MRSTFANQPDSAPTRRRRAGLIVISVVTVLGVLAFATACGGRFRNRGSDNNDGGNTASAGPSTSVPVGSSSYSMTVGGLDRTYHLYRPASASLSSPLPLVIMLHGALGTGSQAEKAYGWDSKADSGHFIVAYPDGYHRTWNAGGCCGPAQSDHVDDVAFIQKMVSTISADLPINQKRIYATGISNGGLMAYRLACDTDMLAAIGPDSATMISSCSSPSKTSVIHIHGTADQTIPFHGGYSQSPQKVDWPSVPSTISKWRKIDDCQSPTSSTAGKVTTSVSQCADGRTVELITISGAGHQWPGGESDTAGERLLGLDQPSTALNATATMWKFFTAHPKES
jgi:polyhydroxybutyrate depolymerase